MIFNKRPYYGLILIIEEKLSALPKDTTSEIAGLSSYYSFFERQAGKL